MVEQRSDMPKAVGSIPTWSTFFIINSYNLTISKKV